MMEHKHTSGPWKWTSFTGSPQLEGSNEHAEMNPVLVARGCGNAKPTAQGVEGCMPESLKDELRACPLHPTQADRDLIAAAPDLLDMVTALTVLGWTVERVSCYDEEGVEGWRWQDKNGQDVCTVLGDWQEIPEWSDACRAVLAKAVGASR